MVKHQRRSHQQGMHPNDVLDDCSSDSDSDESPSTPQTSSVTWSPQDMMPMNPPMPQEALHRTSSYPEFRQQVHGYPLHQHQPQPQPQQYIGRHAIPSSVPPEFHPHPVVEQQTGMPMMHRAASIPRQAYYVTDHSNPGIATMTTNPVQSQYQLAQQQAERPTIEMPYSAATMAASIQSSPSAFSVASVQSPLMQDGGFYQPPQQHPSTYSIQAASPVDSHHSLPTYQTMHQAISHAQQTVATQAPPQNSTPAPETYSQSTPQPEEHWPQYQAPMEVATIGQLPAYGTGVYDLCGPKLEFDDPTMQLPSSRLETI